MADIIHKPTKSEFKRMAVQLGYTRLRELAEADKDGRVVVLPCKVGDVVYGFHGEKTILPMVAKWIGTNTDGWCMITGIYTQRTKVIQ